MRAICSSRKSLLINMWRQSPIVILLRRALAAIPLGRLPRTPLLWGRQGQAERRFEAMTECLAQSSQGSLRPPSLARRATEGRQRGEILLLLRHESVHWYSRLPRVLGARAILFSSLRPPRALREILY